MVMGVAETCVAIEEKLWHFLRASEKKTWDNLQQFQISAAVFMESLWAQGLTSRGTGSWELKDRTFILQVALLGEHKYQSFTLCTTLNWDKQLMEMKQELQRWQELTMMLPYNFEECNSPPWTQVEDYAKKLREELGQLQAVLRKRGVPRLVEGDTQAAALDKFIGFMHHEYSELQRACEDARRDAEELKRQRDGMSKTIDGYMKSLEEAKEQYDDLDRQCANLAKARNIEASKAQELDKQMSVVRALIVENNLSVDSGELPSRTVARYVGRLQNRLKEMGEPTDGLGPYPGQKPSPAEQLRVLHNVIITRLMHKLWDVPGSERVDMTDVQLVEKAGELIDSLRVEVNDLLKEEEGYTRRPNEQDAELLTELEQLHRIDAVARKVYERIEASSGPVPSRLRNELAEALFDGTKKGPVFIGIDYSKDYLAEVKVKARVDTLQYIKEMLSAEIDDADLSEEKSDYGVNNYCETEEGKKWCGAYVRVKDEVTTCANCGKVIKELKDMSPEEQVQASQAWKLWAQVKK